MTAESEAFSWDHHPLVKSLFEKTCRGSRADVERREQVAADRVLHASFEDVTVQAEGDQARFSLYQSKQIARSGE